MKAIIHGLRYDTDKATLIGEAYSDAGITDFSYWKAALYVTPRAKRYFLAGEGGPMTRWSKSTGTNSWTGSSRIIPLDDADALEWAEQNLTAEQIEAGFKAAVQDA